MTRMLLTFGLLLLPAAAPAEDLYRDPAFSAMSSDRRAGQVGDILTINIFQAAEATNSAHNASRKSTDLSGSIDVPGFHKDAEIEFGGGYSGRGEVRRSERFISQMSLTVQDVLPNGDLVVGGEQWLLINGERTRIGVRGRVRPADIRGDNSVVSTRIADAEIDYDGRGFVSRSAKPGLITRVFSFLGLI